MILVLLRDHAGRPQPHLFSDVGFEEMHKDERERLVAGSRRELEYPDMRSLSELAMAYYPHLFPPVCDSSPSEHTDNLAPGVVACLLPHPGTFLEVWERGE